MKRVGLVGCDRPGRTVVMAALLKDCIDIHGWGERLSVLPFGVLEGGGAADPEDLEAVRNAGLNTNDIAALSVEQSPDLLAGCEVLVAVSDVSADLVIQLPGCEGKAVLCIEDLVEGEVAAALRNGCASSELVKVLGPEMPEVLRKLVAI